MFLVLIKLNVFGTLFVNSIKFDEFKYNHTTFLIIGHMEMSSLVACPCFLFGGGRFLVTLVLRILCSSNMSMRIVFLLILCF